MTRRRISRRRQALSLAAVALAAPVLAAPTSDVAALNALERGRWQVRNLDSGENGAALCLGDPAQLVRLEHQGGTCPLEVIDDGNVHATVQYSCAGRGFGHTKLRVETPRLIRIETQGLSNGRPFSHRFEAKRIGKC